VRIAVASGKGGTGKTTLATNLAVVALQLGRSVAYVDCDVEAPNGHLFLKPTIEQRQPVSLLVPHVLVEACDRCGLCAEVCQYSALVWLGDQPLVFPELCHSCGGCALVCPKKAIREVPREIGVVETGHAGDVRFVHGLLNVGEAKSPPVIRAVRAAVPEVDWQIIDAPPGTSCPVVNSVRNCDFVLLVTEPTPFGLHDLTLAVQTVRQLGLPMGVVLNRADIGDDRVATYCAAQGIPVLLTIPDDRRIATAYSRGELIVTAVPKMRAVLRELWGRMDGQLAGGAAGREPEHALQE
jgi:MinD superfamily P-loop ATPase